MIQSVHRAVAAALLMLAAASPVAAEAADPRADAAAFVQPDNGARAAALTALLDREGLPWTLETFAGGNPRTGPLEGANVVVTLGAGERELLLTAHYDAVRLPDGRLADGVVDNAASVVALVRAAGALRDANLRHRVRVIFFDQEELGLIGAYKWIEAHGVANVAAVVNSDVAAFGEAMMYGLNNGPQSAPVVRAVRETCAEQALTCIGFPVYPPSDDRAFIAAGAPTVSLGFQTEIGAHQMWLAFNGGEASGLAEGFVPEVFALIHSDQDVLDRLDPATVERAAETYAALIRRLDAALD